jgi:DNA-binding NarL/FixJ family response regulator
MALFRFASQRVTEPLQSVWGTELGLSRREHQMVELLRERLTNKEIASQLNLSEQTVKNHVHNISRKVGATDRVNIVKLCEAERLRATAQARD